MSPDVASGFPDWKSDAEQIQYLSDHAALSILDNRPDQALLYCSNSLALLDEAKAKIPGNLFASLIQKTLLTLADSHKLLYDQERELTALVFARDSFDNAPPSIILRIGKLQRALGMEIDGLKSFKSAMSIAESAIMNLEISNPQGNFQDSDQPMTARTVGSQAEDLVRTWAEAAVELTKGEDANGIFLAEAAEIVACGLKVDFLLEWIKKRPEVHDGNILEKGRTCAQETGPGESNKENVAQASTIEKLGEADRLTRESKNARIIQKWFRRIQAVKIIQKFWRRKKQIISSAVCIQSLIRTIREISRFVNIKSTRIRSVTRMQAVVRGWLWRKLRDRGEIKSRGIFWDSKNQRLLIKEFRLPREA